MTKKNIPNKTNPAFGIITPTAYCESFAVQSNFHLVLAHLIEQDPKYTEFYKRMSARGDYIICDNSAFELGESYPPDQLIELGSRVDADALVLPDYPFQPAQKTIDAAEERIASFKDAGFETFFVPQSEVGDLDDWIRAYEYASNNPDIDIIGLSILGIPNAIPHIPKSYARVVMTQLLIDRGIFNFSKYHHFLGSNSGVGLEIPPLIKMGAMDSMDTSNPVWHGILGHEYTTNTDSLLPVKKVKMHVQFDYPMIHDEDTLNRIQRNIDLSLDLFK